MILRYYTSDVYGSTASAPEKKKPIEQLIAKDLGVDISRVNE